LRKIWLLNFFTDGS